MRHAGKQKLLLVIWICVMVFTASAAVADSPYDGWWFIPDHPGTGLSLEIQGSTMFAAIFTYDQGDPVWYSSAAAYNTSQKVYSGTLSTWANNSVEGGPMKVSSTDAGTFQISFQSEKQAVMTYSIKDKVDPLTVTLKKFMPVVSPGTADNRVKGWWYNPAMNGTGIFLEAEGATLFGAWYMYHSKEGGGLPFWFSFTGVFPASASNLAVPVTYWKNGSPLGTASYKAPVSSNVEGHELRLSLKADGSLDVTWRVNGKETVLHMVRFRF